MSLVTLRGSGVRANASGKLAQGCGQMTNSSVELEELRELKEDVARRERAQALVIENQAKRLDELETLYKV